MDVINYKAIKDVSTLVSGVDTKVTSLGAPSAPYGIPMPTPVEPPWRRPMHFTTTKAETWLVRPTAGGTTYDEWSVKVSNTDITCYGSLPNAVQWTYAPSDINASATEFITGMHWDTAGSTGEFDKIYVIALQPNTRLWIAYISLNSGVITQVANYATLISSVSTSTENSYFGRNFDGTFTVRAGGIIIEEYASDFGTKNFARELLSVVSQTGYPNLKIAPYKYTGYYRTIVGSTSFLEGTLQINFQKGLDVRVDNYVGVLYLPLSNTPFRSVVQGSDNKACAMYLHGDYFMLNGSLIQNAPLIFNASEMQVYLESLFDLVMGEPLT